MVLGIDASNAGSGGIVNYLVELIKSAQPEAHGFSRVIIWAPVKLLNKLDSPSWLQKKSHPLLQKNLIYRTIWRRIILPNELKKGCTILYSPGGIYRGDFEPYVVCCMNMLPFEKEEKERYRLYSWFRLKMFLTLRAMLYSFKNSSGIIFLSNYARSYMVSHYFEHRNSRIINFGARQLYSLRKKKQLPKESYTRKNPFRILYISPITAYKHQGVLAEAIAKLEKNGYNIELNLCGAHDYQPTLAEVHRTMNLNSRLKEIIKLHGFTSHNKLLELRKSTDAYAFSSSCENMPTTLIEYMSSGRPIACSNMGPMPEFLQDAGFYYDPTSTEDTYKALKEMIDNVDERRSKVSLAHELVKSYRWVKCSHDTFNYLSEVVEHN